MAAEWGPIKLITALKGAAVKDFPLPKAAVTLKASQTPQEAHHTLLLGNVQVNPGPFQTGTARSTLSALSWMRQ